MESIALRHLLKKLNQLNVVGLTGVDEELLKNMTEQTLNDNNYGYIKVKFFPIKRLSNICSYLRGSN